MAAEGASAAFGHHLVFLGDGAGGIGAVGAIEAPLHFNGDEPTIGARWCRVGTGAGIEVDQGIEGGSRWNGAACGQSRAIGLVARIDASPIRAAIGACRIANRFEHKSAGAGIGFGDVLKVAELTVGEADGLGCGEAIVGSWSFVATGKTRALEGRIAGAPRIGRRAASHQQLTILRLVEGGDDLIRPRLRHLLGISGFTTPERSQVGTVDDRHHPQRAHHQGQDHQDARQHREAGFPAGAGTGREQMEEKLGPHRWVL